MIRTLIVVVAALAFPLALPASAQTPRSRPAPAAPVICDPAHLLPGCRQAADASSGAADPLAGIDLNGVGKQLQAVVKDLVDKGIADLTAASTDAKNRNDKIAQPCWDAQVAFLQLLPAEWQTPPTDVGPALAIQISRDLMNAITGSDQTSLKVACAALWGDQLNILQNTLAVVGIKAALTAAGVP